MELSRDDLRALALEIGVRPEGLEKVVRLLGVIERLGGESEVRSAYALKGGTALNAFWLPLPRLSVDIDLNFIGEVGRSELQLQRPGFERGVTRACQLAGCRVLHSPGEHAGGKYRLRFPSVLGGEQNLEVDVSYVARVPLFGLQQRHCVLRGFEASHVTTYSIPELAGGKFAALMGRTVARDQYDAVRLLELESGLLDSPEFRIAFTCHAAGSRTDSRGWKPEVGALDLNDVRNRLAPLLRFSQEPLAGDPRALARGLRAALEGVAPRLVAWSEAERAFLDALLDRGELHPELLTSDPELSRRIGAQPMLRWKQIHVRKHRGLPPVDSLDA